MQKAVGPSGRKSCANLDAYFSGAPLENEICYRCLGTGGANKSDCPPRRTGGRCHRRNQALSNSRTKRFCLGDELGAVDGSFFVHAVCADHAALFAALVAVEETA